MNCKMFIEVVLCGALTVGLSGCDERAKANASAEAPPAARIEQAPDANFMKVDHPDQFPLVTAEKYVAAPELNVTGVVNPDVSRNVPAISLASGRVVEVDARLGDEVKKGQLLMRVRSTDVSGAFSDYRKAVENEQLAKIQLDRAKTCTTAAPIAKRDLEVAQNAEDKASVDLRDHGRASKGTRCRPGTPGRHRRRVRARFRRDHRPASDGRAEECRHCLHRILSRFPICPTSGSCATCTKTICPSYELASLRTCV